MFVSVLAWEKHLEYSSNVRSYSKVKMADRYIDDASITKIALPTGYDVAEEQSHNLPNVYPM